MSTLRFPMFPDPIFPTKRSGNLLTKLQIPTILGTRKVR